MGWERGHVGCLGEIAHTFYTANTTIYIYYGNSSISTDQSNPTGVWDANFLAVWHLKENPTGSAPR